MRSGGHHWLHCTEHNAAVVGSNAPDQLVRMGSGLSVVPRDRTWVVGPVPMTLASVESDAASVGVSPAKPVPLVSSGLQIAWSRLDTSEPVAFALRQGCQTGCPASTAWCSPGT